jgi:hypothetical protein
MVSQPREGSTGPKLFRTDVYATSPNQPEDATMLYRIVGMASVAALLAPVFLAAIKLVAG